MAVCLIFRAAACAAASVFPHLNPTVSSPSFFIRR